MSEHRGALLAIALLLAVSTSACGTGAGMGESGKPTVDVLSPPSGSRVSAGQEVEVGYRASDAVAVVRVELEVGRQIVDLQNSPTAEGQPSLTGVLRWTPLTPGTHTLMLYAFNRDGVTSDGVGLEIIVAEGPASQLTVTAPIGAPTQPAATLVFSDDFSDSDSGWSVASEENYALGYDGGEYFIEHIQRNDASRWLTYPDQAFSDFTAEVEARFDTDDEFVGAALIWRWQDNDNFYLFRIRNTGEYDLRKRVEGEWQNLIPGTSSSHVNSGIAANRLKVTAVGDLTQIYVNDQHLADFTDSSLDQGRIGLYASVYTASPITTRVFFDNLQVSVSGEEAMQLTPSPTAPMAMLAFSDDFDDPESGWAVTSGEGYAHEYEGGEYFIEYIGQTDRSRLVTHPERTFSDFTAEVEVRFGSDVDSVYGGLVWRRQDNNNFYRLIVYNTGDYGVKALLEGEWRVLVDRAGSPHINIGTATNMLKVVALGDLVSIYVNDHHLADFTDSSIKEGRIGLYAGVSAESPATTRIFFDNLRVYAPSSVASPTVTALSPTVAAPVDTPIAPTPIPPSGPTTIFEDDFDQPGGARALFGRDFMTFDYVGGEGRLTTTYQGGVLPAMYASPKVADFVAEFHFRAASATPGSGYGLIFRSDDAEDGLAWYYQVLIRPVDGTAVFECWKDGEWVVKQTHDLPPGLVLPVGTNHVRVEAAGSGFRVSINGTLAVEATDTQLAAPGILGLSMVSGIGGSDTVYFDNLVVSAPTAAHPQAPTVPSWPLALADDFDDPGSGFFESSTQSYRLFYQGGRFGIELLEEALNAVGTRGDFSDFVMEVDVILQDAIGGAGMIFRREGLYQYYDFEIVHVGKYSLRKSTPTDLEYIIDWRESPHIRTGASSNRLKVVCEGSTISLYANGQLLETVRDTTFTGGELGMAATVYPGEPYGLYYFDNLRVYAP